MPSDDLSNRDLLDAMKTEIGWLRNELIRTRSDYERLQRDTAATGQMVKEMRDNL